jgi:hypothetical protein
MSEQRRFYGIEDTARMACIRIAAAAFCIVVLSGTAIVSPANAADGINCSCVANGQRIELGRLFCIKTASGKQFLARCERVLNNTSWTRLQDGCPTAGNWSQAIDKSLL